MQTSPGSLCFLFSSKSSLSLQKIVIDKAVNDNRKVVLLYSGEHDDFFRETVDYSNSLGIAAISLGAELISAPTPHMREYLFSSIGWRPLFALGILFLLRNSSAAWNFRRIYAKRLVVARTLLKRIDAIKVICSEDGISSDLAALSAARQLGIPVVDIPYGCGTLFEIEFDLQKKAEEQRLLTAAGLDSKLLKLLAPQWIKKGRFAGSIIFPCEMILAMESLSITLRDAWIIHGGYSDILCVENSVSLLQYQKENVPAEKMRGTGSPYCDVMLNSLESDLGAYSALRKPVRIQDNTIRILVSWPPSYHDTYPGRSEFSSYDEMTCTILKHLKNLPAVHLTVSLHPACNVGTYEMLKSIGIEVTTDYVLGMIPRHDIFVTYFSSTIRWALAAGKIVVNYDAYDLKLPTFDSAPGFFNIQHFVDFQNTLHQLTNSEEYFCQTLSKQIEQADSWGTLDGLCTSRIFYEIDKMG